MEQYLLEPSVAPSTATAIASPLPAAMTPAMTPAMTMSLDFERLATPCCLLDADRRFIWANQAFSMIVGLGNDHLRQTHFDDLRAVERPQSDHQAIELSSLTPLRALDGRTRWLDIQENALPAGVGDNVNLLFGWPADDRVASIESDRLILSETQHRARNLLTMVMSLASQVLGPHVPAASLDSFIDRLRSLDAAVRASCDMLDDRCPVTAIVTRVLARFHDPAAHRVTISGDEIDMSARWASVLALIIHELATNAVKYGALGSRSGRVAVIICRRPTGQIHLEWRELDGPAAHEPHHEGFGLKFIQEIVGQHAQCSASLRFPATGAVCTLEFPALN